MKTDRCDLELTQERIFQDLKYDVQRAREEINSDDPVIAARQVIYAAKRLSVPLGEMEILRKALKIMEKYGY